MSSNERDRHSALQWTRQSVHGDTGRLKAHLNHAGCLEVASAVFNTRCVYSIVGDDDEERPEGYDALYDEITEWCEDKKLSPNDVASRKKALKDMDKKAKHIILSSIATGSNDKAAVIGNMAHAYEMFEYLRSMFGRKGKAAADAAEAKLDKFAWDSRMKVCDFLNKGMAIITEMTMQGSTMELRKAQDKLINKVRRHLEVKHEIRRRIRDMPQDQEKNGLPWPDVLGLYAEAEYDEGLDNLDDEGSPVKKQKAANVTAANVTTDAALGEMRQQIALLTEYIAKQKVQAPEKKKFTGKCFRCDQVGHVARFCKIPAAKKKED